MVNKPKINNTFLEAFYTTIKYLQSFFQATGQMVLHGLFKQHGDSVGKNQARAFSESGYITWEQCVRQTALITSTLLSETLGAKSVLGNSSRFRKTKDTCHTPDDPREVWAAAWNPAVTFLH